MIEELLERIASSLERMEKRIEAPSLSTTTAAEPEPIEEPAPPVDEKPNETPASPPEDKPFDRDAAKDRLRELGVEFKERARDNTLRALLEAAEAAVPKTPEESEAAVPKTPEESEAEPSQSETSIDDVRAAFTKLGETKGWGYVKRVLTDLGAEMVSGIDPANYGNAVKKARALFNE